jgi:hypothetical protein
MWADILTKPLQGTKFIKMRAVLMNCDINYSEEETFHPSPLPIKSSPTNSPMKSRFNIENRDINRINELRLSTQRWEELYGVFLLCGHEWT